MSRLKDKYQKEVAPILMERYGYSNIMEVPRLIKVVLNIGLGEAIQNAKALESAEADLAAISGQHPVITRAKRSIAAFRLRTGMAVGMKVTLRGERMYDFLDGLINAVLPRVREFFGVSPDAFDGRGNYTLGLKEQIAFPEIDYDKIEKLRGLEIAIATTAKTDEEGRHLLELLGMPFAKDGTE
ncbi:MAG TPA: 50S ribosomal protein L5 [Dehalococcoidia bacterium]|nr:50S ribosomal protein L5 [Dehalococcoidia bacterium]